MRQFDCYEYCELDPTHYLSKKILFGTSSPSDDYFNDNLDQFFDEDDYHDYDHSLEKNVSLEDKEWTHSHKPVHH